MRLAKLHATNMEMTPAIRTYVEERLLDGLANLTSKHDPAGTFLDVECGKTSNHHKKGDVFRCEAMVQIPGHQFRAEATMDDLYAAIDAVRDELRGQLDKYDKKMTQRGRKGGSPLKDEAADGEIAEE